MLKDKSLEKYLFILIVIILLYVAYRIIAPFINIILTSIVIAYVFYPLYNLFSKKAKKKRLIALTLTLLILIAFALIGYFTANAILKDSQVIFLLFKQNFANMELDSCELKETTLCKFILPFKNFINDPRLEPAVEETTSNIIKSIRNASLSFIFSIPKFLISLLLYGFLVYFLLYDGSKLVNMIKKFLPIQGSHQKSIFKQFNDMVFATVYGYLVIAMIEGIVAAFWFMLTGIIASTTLGLIVAFLALIPLVGPVVVWVPLFILNIVQGQIGAAASLLVLGIVLFIIDSIVKPLIIGDRARTHPIIIVIGVIGGLRIFGIIGTVIGPLVLSIIYLITKIYIEERS